MSTSQGTTLFYAYVAERVHADMQECIKHKIREEFTFSDIADLVSEYTNDLSVQSVLDLTDSVISIMRKSKKIVGARSQFNQGKIEWLYTIPSNPSTR